MATAGASEEQLKGRGVEGSGTSVGEEASAASREVDEEGEGGVSEWLGEDTGPAGGPWWPTPSLKLANCEVQGDLESMPFKSILRPLG